MSSFHIVAIFPGREQAETAYAQVKHLFQDIQDAHQHMRYQRYGDTLPTWAEGWISEQYGIEWNQTLDWIGEIEQQQSLFLNYVFVTTGLSKTHQFANPIADWLEKLGAQVLVQGDLEGRLENHFISVELTCQAPDKPTATYIEEEMSLYLQAEDREYLIPPWERHCPNVKLRAWNLLFIPYGAIVNQDSVRQAVNALQRYQQARLRQQSPVELEREATSALLALREQGYTLPTTLDHQYFSQLLREVGGLSASSVLKAEIRVEKQTIRISELVFFNPEAGLPALYQYLEHEACTDIQLSSLKLVPQSTNKGSV